MVVLNDKVIDAVVISGNLTAEDPADRVVEIGQIERGHFGNRTGNEAIGCLVVVMDKDGDHVGNFVRHEICQERSFPAGQTDADRLSQEGAEDVRFGFVSRQVLRADDLVNTRIADHTSADRARLADGDGFSGTVSLCLCACQVQRGADQVAACSREHGVLFSVNRCAVAVVAAVVRLVGARAYVVDVAAVDSAAGRAIVAGGDDLIVLDDDAAILAFQAGAAGGYFHGDFEVIAVFADAFHMISSFRLDEELFYKM